MLGPAFLDMSSFGNSKYLEMTLRHGVARQVIAGDSRAKMRSSVSSRKVYISESKKRISRIPSYLLQLSLVCSFESGLVLHSPS